MLIKTTILEACTAFCIGGTNTSVINLHAGTKGAGAAIGIG